MINSATILKDWFRKSLFLRIVLVDNRLPLPTPFGARPKDFLALGIDRQKILAETELVLIDLPPRPTGAADFVVLERQIGIFLFANESVEDAVFEGHPFPHGAIRFVGRHDDLIANLAGERIDQLARLIVAEEQGIGRRDQRVAMDHESG